MGNPQKYFVKAQYDHTDGQSQGAVTLAVTDNVPKGATITDVIIEKVENITSGGAAVTTITAGETLLACADFNFLTVSATALFSPFFIILLLYPFGSASNHNASVIKG